MYRQTANREHADPGARAHVHRGLGAPALAANVDIAGGGQLVIGDGQAIVEAINPGNGTTLRQVAASEAPPKRRLVISCGYSSKPLPPVLVTKLRKAGFPKPEPFTKDRARETQTEH